MRGPDTDSQKTTHVSVRLDEETVAYLDGLGEEWGFVRDDGSVNRSETLRTAIKAHNGLVFGNFFGVVDPDKLSEEWGDVGHLLAAGLESERGVPESVDRARLADVLHPLPMLVSAAEVELEGGRGD